jgi:hypothetical protein
MLPELGAGTKHLLPRAGMDVEPGTSSLPGLWNTGRSQIERRGDHHEPELVVATMHAVTPLLPGQVKDWRTRRPSQPSPPQEAFLPQSCRRAI